MGADRNRIMKMRPEQDFLADVQFFVQERSVCVLLEEFPFCVLCHFGGFELIFRHICNGSDARAQPLQENLLSAEQVFSKFLNS